MQNNIENIVMEMNTVLYEKHKMEDYQFEYSSTGFSSAISFSGCFFWSSEDDMLEDETVEQSIKRKFAELQETISKIKL